MSKKRPRWTDGEDAQLSRFAKKLRASGKLQYDGKITASVDGVFEFARKIERPVASVVIRWNEHLRPELNRSDFTEAEDAEILRLAALHDGYSLQWKRVADDMHTSRTPKQVRNRYLSLASRMPQKPEETPAGNVTVPQKAEVEREIVPEEKTPANSVPPVEFPTKKDAAPKSAEPDGYDRVKVSGSLYSFEGVPAFRPGKSGKLTLGLVKVPYEKGMTDAECDAMVAKMGLLGIGSFTF